MRGRGAVFRIIAAALLAGAAAAAEPAAKAADAVPPIDTDAVAAQIDATVPADLARYFDLFFYVSKAAEGPWAQRLFVFHKGADGDLVFEQDFPVSTGREREEQYFTTTPTGIFELDPDRFFTLAHSDKWHGAPMPHAMFLNYSYRTRMTGVALHAATGHLVKKLGHRASGGCVRLPPEMATELFGRIKDSEHGEVPVLAFDEDRGTTNVHGKMALRAGGTQRLAAGYRVLLVIADTPGPAPS